MRIVWVVAFACIALPGKVMDIFYDVYSTAGNMAP